MLKLMISALPVAPHVGAWIEIVVMERNRRSGKVAPHVGAWIEMWKTP